MTSYLTTDTISPELLRKQAGNEMFEQGQKLYRQEKVSIERVTERAATCQVHDYRTYTVEISLNGRFLYLQCNCRHGMRGLICEHSVAASLTLQDHLRVNRPSPWRSQLNRIMQAAKSTQRRVRPHPYLLLFSLQNVNTYGTTTWKVTPHQIPLSALPKEVRGETNQLNDLNALHQLVEQSPELSFHLKVPFQPLVPEACVNVPPEGVMLANLMIDRERTPYGPAAYPLHDFLTLIHSTNSPLFLGGFNAPLEKGLFILPEAAELRVRLHRDDQAVHLIAGLVVGQAFFSLSGGQVQIIAKEPTLILADRFLFRLSEESTGELLPALMETPEVLLRPNEEAEFLERFYLPLAQQLPLEGQVVQWESIQSVPQPRLYLNEYKNELHAQLRFAYDGHEVDYDADFPEEHIARKPDTWTLVRIQRKPEMEEQAFKALSTNAYGLKRLPLAPRPGTFGLRARMSAVDFLLHGLPRLHNDGFEVVGEENLKSARVNRNTPSISFDVSSGIDWFDVKVNIQFGDVSATIKDLRKAMRKRERFVKLVDGTIGEIPKEWFERYRHLFAFGEEAKSGVRLSSKHITLLDDLLDKMEGVQTDSEFDRRRQRLRELRQTNFAGITPHPLPSGFIGELRPYQKAGYDWMHFLNEFEFGGCLADDMGLGKTIQLLAYMQSLYEMHKATTASLVVVPRSLLVNWQREAARFTPGLKIVEHFEARRARDPQEFNEAQVVITTYGVMLRDIEILRKYPFYLVVLDESQVIKNPSAQTTKAARLLRSSHRLVLTGTPVENSTTELWSQFSFLNPGLLGSLEYFKEEFSGPIERKSDDEAAEFLRKMIYPFLLRRTKDQVAPELPPRTERIVYCDMETAQRKFYIRTRDFYRGMLLGLLENEGLNQHRLKVLEGLLRLRQISNHPILVDKKFRGESGKFELLFENLETLRLEKHKVLVFSQFVQMLRLVRGGLDERNLPYAYLDGQTRDRQEQVDRFQNEPELPYFLISLKAGGLGLNLTAADYVIHIDPWWNPAVEQQATDRTHRIGQDKPVFVYKMITRDSVEEKILVLQERKRNLVEQIITTETDFLKDLTVDDIQVLFG